jgi:hypothetical protein
MLSVLTLVSAAGPCEPLTCHWLWSLYNNTNGPNWKKTGDWGNPKKDPCSWNGVVCNTKTKALQDIHLDKNKLAGRIPDPGPMCDQFHDANPAGDGTLSYLHLEGNELTGPIPDGFRKCRSLQRLVLNSNQLEGPIPAFDVATQPYLFYTYLHDNKLTGKIPASIATLDAAKNPDSSASNAVKLAGNEYECPIPDAVLKMKTLKDKPKCN